MALKKNWIFAILATCCLMSILFLVIPIISAPTAGVYDPWIDTNDDGIINYQDLYNLASTYGTSGTPINKTNLILELQSKIDSLNASLLDLSARVTTLEVPGKVIAAGFIDDDGTISVGYNLESVTWNAAQERYEISITDVSYYFSNYVTLVTPSWPELLIARTGSVSGKLLITLYDDAGNEVQGYFQFVTYEISALEVPVSLIAAGFIDNDGTISVGYNLESVTWNAVQERYEISITDVSYYFSNYVTIVTPSWPPKLTAETNSVSGKLLIFLYDDAGNKVQGSFQFATYKIAE